MFLEDPAGAMPPQTGGRKQAAQASTLVQNTTPMTSDLQHYTLADERQTEHWGATLATALPEAMLEKQAFLITLHGDLGAGKTTLTRAVLRALGVKGRIKSPTYPLVETYNLPRYPVYHFDLYRFSSPDQWFDAGFDDIFAAPGLMLIEWPEQASGALPPADLDLRLSLAESTEERHLVVHALSVPGKQCLTSLANLLKSADDSY
ncbi:MAG: tRNA (adenosine(37)-N6)-threonylcarbamoyltransferase complex ATPase subunit type 1 TsaE [Lautropia sp.]|nr:tRNA (adenosine(37)-N6)-threonylcarbamoyltransferase complex ATPase subunit type 1 TsaE [Lautropia sp.]